MNNEYNTYRQKVKEAKSSGCRVLALIRVLLMDSEYIPKPFLWRCLPGERSLTNIRTPYH